MPLNDLYRTLLDRLAAGLVQLPDKPEETPESTLRALWYTAAGQPRSVMAARDGDLPALPADGAPRQILERLVDRRLAGVPLAHLTGRQHFMGLEMLAGPAALVPRRETELLARAAIELAHRMSVRVLDVCTGCGNLALAIARHVPHAEVFGADLSADAVTLAIRNAVHLGLDARVQFRAGDLLMPFDTPDFHGQVDLLTCNPPYISSARIGTMADEIASHEPRLAFDGGPFGVTILLRLIDEAPRFLRRGGWLAFEVGLGQGAALVKRLQGHAHFREVRPLLDDDGAIRAILACGT